MALVFPPSYLGTVTLNSDILTTANVTSLDLSKGGQFKPVFGAQYSQSIPGVITGTFAGSGHVATTVPLADLMDAIEAVAPVPFEMQIGDAAGASDSGKMAGSCNLTGISVSGDAEGEWDWSFTANISGDVTYTAATP